MKTIKSEDGRKFSLEALVALVVKGEETIEQLTARCGASVAKKVAKAVSAVAKPDTITLTGSVKQVTDKAVLFTFDNRSKWFPLSQVKVIERAIGNADQLVVAGWLATKLGLAA